MATNLAINDNLILEAKKIGGHRTKKEAVWIKILNNFQRYLILNCINRENYIRWNNVISHYL